MKQSAGILLFRHHNKELEFFLVHPGGPFFKNKNSGWWTVPKGEILPDEEPLKAALREFEEETGYIPSGEFQPLHPIIQKGGKHVLCWAVSGDLNPSAITSNTFILEWPPRSGQTKTFPEIDKAGWFNFAEAKKLINEKQLGLLTEFINIHSDKF